MKTKITFCNLYCFSKHNSCGKSAKCLALGTSHLLPGGWPVIFKGVSEFFLVMYWGGGAAIFFTEITDNDCTCRSELKKKKKSDTARSQYSEHFES